MSSVQTILALLKLWTAHTLAGQSTYHMHKKCEASIDVLHAVVVTQRRKNGRSFAFIEYRGVGFPFRAPTFVWRRDWSPSKRKDCLTKFIQEEFPLASPRRF
jgi:hypothetical protein